MATMADKIRKLLAKGWSSTRIAAHLGLPDTGYVCRVRWTDARPGYKAALMRKLRSENPEYYERELDQRAATYQASKRRAANAVSR